MWLLILLSSVWHDNNRGWRRWCKIATSTHLIMSFSMTKTYNVSFNKIQCIHLILPPDTQTLKLASHGTPEHWWAQTIISRVYPDPYTSLNTKCRYRQTFESVVVQLSISIVRELYDGSGCWSCQTPQKAPFNRLWLLRRRPYDSSSFFRL